MTNIVATAPGKVQGQQMISQPHHSDDMPQIQTDMPHCGKYIIEYCDHNTVTPHGLTTYRDISICINL